MQPARECVCLRDAAGLAVTAVIKARNAVKFPFTHIVLELILTPSFPTQALSFSDNITGVVSKRNSKGSN